ncbi:MAG: bifunctional DNA-binding transcriptional regulator/O6-methylguanine-DNA methyltransferase Ada [Gammaproteobacteria bacterium]|nr:MAG: bifunctional DNA-binding transcriptional regulator/O6-methylguanine-DNA methyltransferase Ada [Gammaproteobacteria bacterium]
MTTKHHQANQTTEDARWQAVVTRDDTADGTFVYAVHTTGIYCRPSCAARLARSENINFYTSPHEAEAAGFRACKRCKPNQTNLTASHTEKVASACRLLETSEIIPSLEDLAKNVGLSKYHFQRLFKRITGVTPKAYAQAYRTQKLREQLSEDDSVTNAIYAAGYNTQSRFYAESNKVLGMTASEFRKGGANTVIKFALGECSLGTILVAQSERGVCAIQLGDDPTLLLQELEGRFPNAELIGADRDFEKTVAQIVGFVETPTQDLNLPLDIRGTAFQQRVWQALTGIPLGTTASYSEIAQRIGAPKSFRAVAMACGANNLAVVIPCHRVVRNDGNLSGYRWGVERKKILLSNEKFLSKNELNEP